MSGQTFEENIRQEVDYLLRFAENSMPIALHEEIVDEVVKWAVGRFGAETASAEYLDSVGAELAEKYRPVYEARREQKGRSWQR